MTLAIGERSLTARRAACPQGRGCAELHRRGSRRLGFTMVEVLMVISIIILLSSLVMVAATTQRRSAAIKATEALFERLKAGLEEYRDTSGHYPPDGFDSPVTDDKGRKLRGSAALYHFLSREMVVEKKVSGRVSRHTIAPILEFKQSELSVEDPNQPGIREIVDGFGVPIHYDNTENGQFKEQDGSAHTPEELVHPADPRASAATNAVTEPGLQGKGYDFWSHGPEAHKEVDDLSGTISSWNLGLRTTE